MCLVVLHGNSLFFIATSRMSFLDKTCGYRTYTDSEVNNSNLEDSGANSIEIFAALHNESAFFILEYTSNAPVFFLLTKEFSADNKAREVVIVSTSLAALDS